MVVAGHRIDAIHGKRITRPQEAGCSRDQHPISGAVGLQVMQRGGRRVELGRFDRGIEPGSEGHQVDRQDETQGRDDDRGRGA